MCDSLVYTWGNKSEAIEIMREAARWLIDTGKPMWDPDDLTEEKMPAPSSEFCVARLNNKGVAAMTLCFEDRFFWPGIPANRSGFIHKLSVRREYAGQGFAKALIDHAKAVCKSRGIGYLRLDCDAGRRKLCEFYEGCGFCLVETKSLSTSKLGKFNLALYELKL